MTDLPPLFRRLLWAKQNLRPVQPKYRIVWEDPNDPDAPVKVTLPAPEWLSCALHGGILPPVEAYFETEYGCWSRREADAKAWARMRYAEAAMEREKTKMAAVEDQFGSAHERNDWPEHALVYFKKAADEFVRQNQIYAETRAKLTAEHAPDAVFTGHKEAEEAAQAWVKTAPADAMYQIIKYPAGQVDPIGPLTEEEAMEYLVIKDLPQRVWSDPGANSLRFRIVRAECVPANRSFRNAWELDHAS